MVLYLSVTDLNGNWKQLQRYKVTQAQEILGIDLSPDGGTHHQKQKMVQASITWADSMQLDIYHEMMPG
jgi:23S rRNA U2552 (ribose-2'-O)-methylase RlmE/FtsJ